MFKERMNFEDFISFYPPDQEVLNMTKFAEFVDLPYTENVPAAKSFLLHQRNIARFMSVDTNYNNLLVYHRMGTGKTLTALAVAEGIRDNPDSTINGCLIVTKGTSLHDVFKRDLVDKTPSERYIVDKYETKNERTNRENRLINQFYSFSTFDLLAKGIRNQLDMFQKLFSNKLIIIDEVHNIRGSNDSDVYKNIHTFLHRITNSKVMLMSGTPMKDEDIEIVSLLNLLLPMDQQLVDEDVFNHRKLKAVMKNKVSFLSSQDSEIPKIYQGEEKVGGLNHFKVVPLHMQPFQSKAFQEAVQLDKVDLGVFSNSKQTSLFVFPDGSWGKNGFSKWMSGSNKMKASLKNYFRTLDDVRKYSVKYAWLIDLILQKKGENFLVYSDLVKGSGLIVLSGLMNIFGIKHAVLSNETMTSISQISKTKALFNQDSNVHGDQIQVIMGSRVILEGYTFNHVQHEVVLTPFWNYTETDQFLARGHRIGTHKLLPNTTVNIYQTCAFGGDKSIDLDQWKISEAKDVKVQKIIRLIIESSVDCETNKVRNLKKPHLDGTRDCQYQSCTFECDIPRHQGAKVFNNLNILYPGDITEIHTKCINWLQRLRGNVTTFDEIKNHLGLTDIQLASVLNQLVGKKALNRESDGVEFWLEEYNDTIYLVDSPLGGGTYDIGSFNCVGEIKFEKALEQTKDKEVLEKWVSAGIEDIENLSAISKPWMVERFLKVAIASKESSMRRKMMDVNKDFWIKDNEKIIVFVPTGINEPVVYNTETKKWLKAGR